MRRQTSRSCGCLQRELIVLRVVKHKMSHSPEYYTWDAMIQRCTNAGAISFNHYGGRGITVCDRWLNSFENFLADMGERPSKDHSIDRINNNGNYDPSNCRWATRKEQNRNRRNSRWVGVEGCVKTIAEWSEISGELYQTIHMRLGYGWSEYDAVMGKR